MNFELSHIMPELILAVGGILVLLLSVFIRKWEKPGAVGVVSPETLSIVVLLAALVPSVMLFRNGLAVSGQPQFGTMMTTDGLAIFFKIIAVVSSIMVALLSVDFFRNQEFHRGEYYALLIFATLAISMLAASTDLIMIYLSIEFLSITSYILVGYLKKDSRSNEAAIKYFLYGSVAAAVMIYGMSMLYGLTGETGIVAISQALHNMELHFQPLLVLSTLMILVGLGFKIAMVPFHQWSPDTYEGAPTPITAFLSVGSKAAGVAILVRFLGTCVTFESFDWVPLIALFAALTMTIGNLVAIPQLNIKRMLAYSSIAQAGYILLGVAAMAYSRLAVPGILLYIFAYLFMNLGAFAVVTILSARIGSDDIREYAGLRKRAPVPAAALAIFLFSLAGIPPTAGFLGKFYIFAAAIESGSRIVHVLAVIAIANVVVSVYYYMNVVRQMYFGAPKSSEPLTPSRPLNFVIILSLIMTFVILIFGQTFIGLATKSATMLNF